MAQFIPSFGNLLDSGETFVAFGHGFFAVRPWNITTMTHPTVGFYR
jgi:hypothetical protein